MQSATQIPITTVMQQSLLSQAQCWRGCAASSSGAASFASSPSPACLLLQGTVTLPHPSPSRRPGKAPGSGRHSTARYTTHHNASELTSEAGSWVWTLHLWAAGTCRQAAQRCGRCDTAHLTGCCNYPLLCPSPHRLTEIISRCCRAQSFTTASPRALLALESSLLWAEKDAEPLVLLQGQTRPPQPWEPPGADSLPRRPSLLSLSLKAEILLRYFSFFCEFILALSLSACSSQQTSAPTCLLVVKLCVLSVVRVSWAAFPS